MNPTRIFRLLEVAYSFQLFLEVKYERFSQLFRSHLGCISRLAQRLAKSPDLPAKPRIRRAFEECRKEHVGVPGKLVVVARAQLRRFFHLRALFHQLYKKNCGVARFNGGQKVEPCTFPGMGPRIEPLPDRGNGHRRILLGGKIDQPNLRAVFLTIHQLRVGFDGQLDQLKGTLTLIPSSENLSRVSYAVSLDDSLSIASASPRAASSTSCFFSISKVARSELR